MSKFVFDTSESRSKLMRKIRSKNTKTEILLRKALYKKGLRYRINVSKYPGKPDILIPKSKIAIFIDGEFWHGYNWEKKRETIKSNRDYWIKKIERNIERDIKVNDELKEMGFKVFRFWEKDIKKDLCQYVDLIWAEHTKLV